MERAGRVISRTKLAAGAVCLEELACAGWPAAVGKKIAAHTRAIALAGGRLRVEVEDAIWQRQLSVLKRQILKRLEEVVGTSVVRDVEYRVAPRRRLPQQALEPRKDRDEADQIQDPGLRAIYRQQRREEIRVKITEQQVRHVAALANLNLSGEQVRRLREDLDEILAHMDKLNELDTSQVEPMAQVLYDAGETATLREDHERAVLGSDVALANAPLAGSGCFKVPKVIER